MKNIKGFPGFDPVTAREWKQKIQVDLKGGDYNELLTWLSPEGITVKPFYTSDDLPGDREGSTGVQAFPWKVGHAFSPAQEGWAERAAEALENGVEELLIHYSPGQQDSLQTISGLPGPKWLDVADLSSRALKEVLGNADPEARWMADPIGNLVATGNWSEGMEQDFKRLAELGLSGDHTASLAIHASHYQHAGANRVQELAYSLAQVHEYLIRYEKEPALAPLLAQPVFLVAMGSEYFFEIAKLRALRRLWRLLGRAHGLSGECRIIAQPGLRNKTLFDYNTNMLRTTMECMAAVLGGADLVCNLRYDRLYQDPNAFADRIARNQLLLLKHESYFDRVSNPADGSYYIESLTDQLGSKALGQFKNVEKGGGLLKQLKAHKIQGKISESAEAAQKAFDSGGKVLVGSNKYPNADDRMGGSLQTDPFLPRRGGKTLIAPILAKRLTETYEKNRLRDE